jgi:hypothetical protein
VTLPFRRRRCAYSSLRLRSRVTECTFDRIVIPTASGRGKRSRGDFPEYSHQGCLDASNSTRTGRNIDRRPVCRGKLTDVSEVTDLRWSPPTAKQDPVSITRPNPPNFQTISHPCNAHSLNLSQLITRKDLHSDRELPRNPATGPDRTFGGAAVDSHQ